MNYADFLLISNRLRSVVLEFIVPPGLEPRISPGELRVTDYLIDQAEPVRVRDIVEHCQLAQSRASTIVQILQKRGWVEVSSDPEDRRVTTVKLKPEVAEPTRQLLISDANEVLDRLLDSASKKDRKTIEDGLACLAKTLRTAGARSPYAVE